MKMMLLALLIFAAISAPLLAAPPKTSKADLRKEIAALRITVAQLQTELKVFQDKEEAERQARIQKYTRWGQQYRDGQREMEESRRRQRELEADPNYRPWDDFIGGGG